MQTCDNMLKYVLKMLTFEKNGLFLALKCLNPYLMSVL